MKAKIFHIDDGEEDYAPIFHGEDDTYVPIYVDDLLQPHHDERDQFLHLRNLLANHLQIQYSEGKLRWPKTRAEINRVHNDAPRNHFPNAGDL